MVHDVLIAFDPGRRTGYALATTGDFAIEQLGACSPEDVLEVLERLSGEGNNPLVVVEDWEVRGAKPGHNSVVPNQVIGMLVGYSHCKGLPVIRKNSRWKREMIQGVEPIPPRVIEHLDRSDRALLARIAMDYAPIFDLIRNLPKDERPHALDAVGLALWTLRHALS